MRFQVDERFWELFPQARIGVVVAHGIDNTREADRCAQLLFAATQQAATRLEGVDIATHPAIAPWRDAYRLFGAKPAKQRSSIENLARSALAQRVTSINPLVDLYNAVSLTYLLPCGGEDPRAVQGDITLTRADGGEPFTPLGDTEDRPAKAGEVIYRDAVGALCRCWNWREAERTKLTSATTDAFLCIELTSSAQERALASACDELADRIRIHLGGDAGALVLSHAHPAIQLDARAEDNR